MKKVIALAGAMLAGLAGTQATAHVVDNTGTEIKKEVTVKPENKRKKEKAPVLDPSFPSLENFFPAFTSPFFSPTRSQRIKNKLNRKYYK